MEETNLYNNKEILAYLAGIIDGEGCLLIRKNFSNKGNPCYSPNLTFAMQNEKPSQLFSSVFGTKSYTTIMKNKNYWGVSIGGKKIKSILESLMPYLMVKKQEALLLLELIKNLEENPRKYYKLDNASKVFGGSLPVKQNVQKEREKLFLSVKSFKNYKLYV